MEDLLIDLDNIFGGGEPNDKIKRAKETLPLISIYAIGGFPIKKYSGKTHLLNQEIDFKKLKEYIQEGLGLSGILTYANRSNLTLSEMGEVCQSRGHFWGYNWMTISLLFVNAHPDVEKSFLRNNTFYQSWIVCNSSIYGMTGSIKDLPIIYNLGLR